MSPQQQHFISDFLYSPLTSKFGGRIGI